MGCLPDKKPPGGSSKRLKEEWVYVSPDDIICPVVLNTDGTLSTPSLLELSSIVALDHACGAYRERGKGN